jgi:hypothetical protein
MNDLKSIVIGRSFVAGFALVAMLLSTGCAFIESAAEITIGDPEITAIEIESTVTLEQVNDALFGGLSEQEKIAAEALGLVLSPDATLTNLRSSLCELWKVGSLSRPRVDVEIEKDDANLKNVKLRLEVPIAANASVTSCYQTGFTAQAIVSFVPWTIEQAAEVKKQLNTDLANLADAIVQVRFSFSRLDFMRGEESITSELLEDFEIVLTADVEDDPTTIFHEGRLSMVPFFLLDSISEETPQRFELDPDSGVTQKIKQTILDPPKAEDDLTMGVEAFVAFKESELFKTPIEGSGFAFKMQPEITINVLKVLN